MICKESSTPKNQTPLKTVRKSQNDTYRFIKDQMFVLITKDDSNNHYKVLVNFLSL